jgi:hypothetical protein
MIGQALNPYLPSNEYVPDGEPYLFDGRVYVYGSHDSFNGLFFCLNDYVCWSAPEEDLSAWRYEGVIYRRNQDPYNKHTLRHLYAPDMAKGPDGRYYLFYSLSFLGIMSVAVCDTPAGSFEFYGHIHFRDGRVWGKSTKDPYAFDPGVLMDDDGRVYLYSGFTKRVPSFLSGFHRLNYEGGYVLELEKDMLTIKSGPTLIFPKVGQGAFKNHEFFEASSIRKINGKYYFVYSSRHNHELCYAVSDQPIEGFRYGGTIVSNGDLFLQGEDDVKHAKNYTGNNHGGIIQIKKQWYVFYHRQTNRHSFSRQGCAEAITIEEDGSIKQVEMTSCGLNPALLKGVGRYESYIACNILSSKGAGCYDCFPSKLKFRKHPYLTQTGDDREEKPDQYIANLRPGAIVGFKYFDIRKVKAISLELKGRAEGFIIVSTNIEFTDRVATIPVIFKGKVNCKGDCKIPDGRQALFFSAYYTIN